MTPKEDAKDTARRCEGQLHGREQGKALTWRVVVHMMRAFGIACAGGTVRSLGRPLFALSLLSVLALSACEKTSHENIDKWRNTQKGPAKLVAALKDKSLDADLRAHAAQALVSMEQRDDALAALRDMADDKRAPIVEKLVPRLWNDAKHTAPGQAPQRKQLHAKDALFELRAIAPPKVVEQIDEYLIDWYLGTGHYEQLARQPTHQARKIMFAIGARATPRLLKHAKELYQQQLERDEYVPVGPELLAGIAVTGSADGVGWLLELAAKPQKQEDLQGQAMLTIYEVYVGDRDLRPAPAALELHIARLQAIGVDVNAPDGAAEAAYDLLTLLPKEKCLPPLVAMAGQRDRNLRWRAVRFGMRCGGLDAIVPLAEALSPEGEYEQGIVRKYFVKTVTEESGLKSRAGEPARALLGSKSWVGRVVGLELLAEVGGKADAAQARKLARDKTVLKGWFGDQSDLDPKQRKKEPTLGERAAAVADLLEKRP